MIHSLSPTRIRRVPTGLDVLDELEAHWSDLKGASLLPDPNELFFGPIADMMPHILLSYSTEGLYRFEYAGAVCQGLLDCDPTGWLVDPDDNPRLLGEAACHVLSAHHRAVPVVSHHDGCVCSHLPFGGPEGEVTMVLSAMVALRDARGAEILQFER
ncbi:MAG: hypothetical protein HOL85_05635 [Rhodospirillaceae bacterium]|jgi:hypothetical protein|nr:hypothetical protein [Rhodospirillaceae bacterium]MBT6137664.1 hypothetical protein [Rhodospirillaceae bacterium]